MVYAHDGVRRRSVAAVRAGDGSFLFLGRLALDLADTGGRFGYEVLREPDDLRRWLRAALSVDVRPGSAELTRARGLRDAIWDLVDAVRSGSVLPARAVAIVNGAAGKPPLAPRLDRRGRASYAEPVSAAAALSHVARDAIDLLAHGDRSRIRVCGEPTCQLVFYDDSRSGARRWCAAERCGDRVRARAYRRRHRHSTSPG